MPRIHDIMSGKDRSLGGHLARLGLSCVEPLYRGIVGVRNAMFDLGLRKPKKLPRPVISVGNITTGGTGKTPMVIEIVRRLLAMGERPAVLTRGYASTFGSPSVADKSEEEIADIRAREQHFDSDEARILRRALGADVPVRVDPDRAAGGRDVLHLRSDITVFVMDDGYQHRQLARDLDLVLIDATEPFGFDHVLPRGMLRESLRNLRRADLIVITRSDHPWKFQDLESRIAQYVPGTPVAQAVHAWECLMRYIAPTDQELRDGLADGTRQEMKEEVQVPLTSIQSVPVAGVCGIGNPTAFETTLQGITTIVGFKAYPDHFDFGGNGEMQRISDWANSIGAQAIVMTEKDWVKVGDGYRSVTGRLPIYRPTMRIEFIAGEDKLDALLKKTLAG
ncbi:MAG: tetraacyldisaccharide 4'-kinase [Phycisphaeraceae bacterium]